MRLEADDFNELLVAALDGADCSQYVVNADRGTDATSAALEAALTWHLLLHDATASASNETIPGGFHT